MNKFPVVLMAIGFFVIAVGAILGLYGLAALDSDIYAGFAGIIVGGSVVFAGLVLAGASYLLLPTQKIGEDPVFESLALNFAGIGSLTSFAGMIFYFIPFVKGDAVGILLFLFFCALGYASTATEYKILCRFPNIKNGSRKIR